MATPLELKKVKAELLRVQAAKADMEVRIEDHMENIGRLNANIVISQAKEDELTKQLADMQVAQ
jgi:septal ring factor EnvC (AmiA/AmiB activator)